MVSAAEILQFLEDEMASAKARAADACINAVAGPQDSEVMAEATRLAIRLQTLEQLRKDLGLRTVSPTTKKRRKGGA